MKTFSNVLDLQPRAAPKPKKRMSINLSGQTAGVLERTAKLQGVTQNEALSKAIAMSAYFIDQIEQGSTILLKKSGSKELTEVVFL